MKLADRRGKVMLLIAWISSCVCSMPQAIIFHLETHPNITNYQQCVTYNFFQNQIHEIIYSFFGMILMYALPLIIIVFCYASIYIELYKKSKKCVTGKFNLEFALFAFVIVFNVSKLFSFLFQIAFDDQMTMYWAELNEKHYE